MSSLQTIWLQIIYTHTLNFALNDPREWVCHKSLTNLLVKWNTSDKNYIIKYLVKYFSSVLNRESIISNDVIDNFPQQPIVEDLSAYPTM